MVTVKPSAKLCWWGMASLCEGARVAAWVSPNLFGAGQDIWCSALALLTEAYDLRLPAPVLHPRHILEVLFEWWTRN